MSAALQKRNRKVIINKASAIIQMSNRITAQQRKAFNVLLRNSRSQLKDDDGRIAFAIKLAEIKDLGGIRAKNNVQLKNALKELTQIEVEYNILKKDKKEKWGMFSLLAGVEIDDGVVTYSFPHQIHENILKPSVYGVIDLNILRGLQSKYAIALYEICRDYQNTGIPRMEIERFRKLMGIEEHQYKNFANLDRMVITPAIEEINEKTDFEIAYEVSRSGRKVTHLRFIIRRQFEPLSGSEDDALEKLILMLPESARGQSGLTGTIRDYLLAEGEEYVMRNIRYTLEHKPKNFSAYLNLALVNNYAVDMAADEDMLPAARDEQSRQSSLVEMERRAAQEEEYGRRLNRMALNYFKTLPADEQTRIRDEVDADRFLRLIPLFEGRVRQYFEKKNITYVYEAAANLE